MGNYISEWGCLIFFLNIRGYFFAFVICGKL